MSKSKFEVIMQPAIIWPIIIGILLAFGFANIEDIERLLAALGEAIGNFR